MLCKTSNFPLKMSTDRLNTLKTFLEESPNDPFIIYCIALEYEKNNDPKCEVTFHQLLTDYPNYLATYYSFGKYLENKNRIDEAEDVFNKGLALAKELGETKTAGELQTAIDLL